MRRALVALLLLLVAACGDGGADHAAAPTTSSPTDATTTTVAPTTATSTTTAAVPDEPPVAATDPAGIARQIARSEEVIRSVRTTDEHELATFAHIEQVAYRALAEHPDWDANVRAALPESLRSAMDANVLAGRQLRALVAHPRPNLPAWRIVEPAPRDELRRYYDEGEATYGVPWQYLAAVNLTETRMGRIRGTSTAGAKGPMQFLPSTWDAYGEGDIENTHDAILTAARYLHANGAPERMDDALHHYNPTDKYVQAVKAYASVMLADERAFIGYYHWQVYYWSTLGDVWLKVGYDEPTERPVQPSDL